MRKWIVFLIILFFLLPNSTSALPEIDGTISDNEWKDAEVHRIEMNTGIFVELSILYTNTHVYYLATIEHDQPADQIILDPSVPHDYFGIEFDNNNDEAIMGTIESPDDTIMVNYEANEGADMYMHSFKAFYDTENGGVDDVDGKAGKVGNTIVFEISRPLDTGDDRGFDVKLVPGDVYQVMIAFWDDQPPHSANLAINARVDNFQFFELTVGSPVPNIQENIIAVLVLLLSLGLGFYVSKFGISIKTQKQLS